MNIGARVCNVVIACRINGLTDSPPKFSARPCVVNFANLNHITWSIPQYKLFEHNLTRRTWNVYIVCTRGISDRRHISSRERWNFFLFYVEKIHKWDSVYR